MIFYAKNAFTLQWTLVDQSNNPINNAVVTATLYAGRSIVNPDSFPGVAVSPISNVTLTYVLSSNGVYQAAIPATLDPPPDITGFVLVIDGTVTAVPVYHYEELSTVVNAQGTTSSADLCTLGQVKSWLGMNPTAVSKDDALLQLLISSFSTWVLHRTGRDSFNTVQTYTETQDGNGGARLFLRNSPITSVTSVNVGNYAIPQSTNVASNGWFIEDSKKSLALRYSRNNYSTQVPTGLYPYQFMRGIGNIIVVYSAGYTAVPFDLQEAVMKAVGVNYHRKDWIDLASKTLSAGQGVSGSTVYHKWILPPEIIMVLDRYTRRALV